MAETPFYAFWHTSGGRIFLAATARRAKLHTNEERPWPYNRAKFQSPAGSGSGDGSGAPGPDSLKDSLGVATAPMLAAARATPRARLCGEKVHGGSTLVGTQMCSHFPPAIARPTKLSRNGGRAQPYKRGKFQSPAASSGGEKGKPKVWQKSTAARV